MPKTASRASVREIQLQFKDFIDGLNTADPRVTVGNRYMGKDRHDSRNGWKQVVDSLDFMLHLKKPRPGNNGFSGNFTTRMKGLGVYLMTDGTEYLLAVAGGILYSINTSTGALTTLYTLTGTGEAWLESYFNKCFVCNGTATCIVEGTTARQIHITAPTGVTAAAVSGGTLPDGLYKIYVSYGIGTDFFSEGLAVADVTCESGNNTIRFSGFAQSADGQVTKKIIWMTDAAGSVWYLFGQADNNSTTTIDISDVTGRSTSYVYTVEAAYNNSTPAFQYIKAFNNYLYGSVDNVLYRSLQAGNAYDLRRFNTGSTGNKATYPFKINGIYAIGADLYLNTVGGMIKIPNGDYNSQIDIKQGHFDYPRTVVEWNQGLLGWTKSGARFFDGEKFYPIDVSRDISTINTIINAGQTTDCQPAACIVRDNERLEYHFGYRDSSVGSLVNNRGLVLNLDTFYFLEDNKAHAAFEVWSRGFNYMVTTQDGTYFGGQAHDTKSVVFKKYVPQNQDLNMYAGDTFTAISKYGWSLQTATILPSLTGRIRALTLWVHATLNKTLYADVVIDQTPRLIDVHDMDGSSESRFGVAKFGVNYFASENPIDKKEPIKASAKGKAVYVRFYQTEDDKLFQLVDSILTCSLKEGRFT
jgi:hypothetical protein